MAMRVNMPTFGAVRLTRRHPALTAHAIRGLLAVASTSSIGPADASTRLAVVAVVRILVRTAACYCSDMPACTRCHKRKKIGDFYAYTENDKHKTGALHAACKRCEHDARAIYRKANPITAAATARRSKIKRLFGITPEQYDDMLSKQGGTCAICQRASPDGRRLHIDHCHATAKVRGLLCHDCNRGLGMFRDNVALFQRALDYLS